jgi:hypothetical protein
MTITYDVVCEMMDFASLSHYRARPMTRQQVAALSIADRKLRRLAKERLRRARPARTFTYWPIEHRCGLDSSRGNDSSRRPEPTPKDPRRDWLSLDPPHRDIQRP